MLFGAMPKHSSKTHLILVLLLLLAGCGPGQSKVAVIEVTDAWLRPPLVTGLGSDRPAAGYMVIINSGDRGDTLLAANFLDSGEQAGRITLHQSRRVDGIARMSALDKVPIPPRSRVELQPGGTHLMVFGLNDQRRQDDTVELTLLFELSGEIAVTFRVGDQKRHRSKNDGKE